MNHPLHALWASLLLAVALTACSYGPLPPGTCEDDSGCVGGTICAFSFCIDPEALGTVDLEVESPGASNLPIQTLLEVDTSSGGRVDIALVPAVEVRGSVVDDNNDAVGATVFAVPTRGIPGRRRQRSTTATADGFSLALVRDQPYRFSALPTAADLPPAFADIDVVAGAGIRPALLVQGVQEVRGRVVSGSGVAVTGLANCEVLVVDDNNRQLSSIATTAVDGGFVISVGAFAGGTQLVVRPNNQYPAVSMPIDLGSGDVVELGDRSLGEELVAAAISGRVINADGSAAARAVVVVRGDVGAGVVKVRQVADDDGNFSVNVVRGDYAIAAVGESESAAGGIVVRTESVAVAILAGYVLTLPVRLQAALDVVTAEGEPVAGASVVLTRIGDEAAGITEPVLIDAQPTFLASSDELGHVDVAVDPGRYRISIEPPRGQGTPAFSALITVRDNTTRTIVLTTSKILAGALKHDNNAVGGAFVRVYSRIIDERGQAILLGEAVSEPDGSFAVSVPDL